VLGGAAVNDLSHDQPGRALDHEIVAIADSAGERLHMEADLRATGGGCARYRDHHRPPAQIPAPRARGLIATAGPMYCGGGDGERAAPFDHRRMMCMKPPAPIALLVVEGVGESGVADRRDGG